LVNTRHSALVKSLDSASHWGGRVNGLGSFGCMIWLIGCVVIYLLT